MTTRARRSGGQSSKPAEAKSAASAGEKPVNEQAKEQAATAAAEAATAAENDGKASDNTSKDGAQPGPQPETHATDGGNAAGDGADVEQQAAFTDTLHLPGDPVPAEVGQSMVRAETGLSPEVPEGDTPVAAYGDNERNGKAVGIPTDTSGELRHVESAVPTAAFGQEARNGHATGMAAEGQLSTGFGGNGDSVARLADSGVRAETGVGTLDRDLPADERPTYPSTTLTRSSSNAAPMEPEDVKYATQPKLGDVQGSLDPVMTAAQMPSMAGDVMLQLVDEKGNEVKPSDIFEVPEGVQARGFRRVKHRVSEVFTVQKVKTPGKRLLFTQGQLVPVDVAETLIRDHG